MPWAPKRHKDGRRDDAEYEARRLRDPALARARKIRSSRRWRKVRTRKLAQDPLCEDCRANGRAVPAQQVHHLQGLRERPDLAYVRENLRALCTGCHARREATEGPGSKT